MTDPKYEKLERELFEELYGLNQLDLSLGQYVQNNTKLQKYNTINIPTDNFDTIARNNLSWLVENSFDRMWSRANEVLDRIIGGLNKGRDTQNMIDLSQPLDPQHREYLNSALIKLWGTPDVLTSGDRIPAFQNRINQALRYPSDHPDGIEWLLQKP